MTLRFYSVQSLEGLELLAEVFLFQKPLVELSKQKFSLNLSILKLQQENQYQKYFFP